MLRTLHFLYISIMVAITAWVTYYLADIGWDYYHTPVEARWEHPDHDYFKASGLMGHGLGIVGTFLVLVGVVLYSAAKKWGFLDRWIRLKYLLEFHIFLCTLGPIMILFHTAFKFGGIVSWAFWSMLLVVISGVIGRYIYLQIPRSISGREMSQKAILDMRDNHLKAIEAHTDHHESIKVLLQEAEDIKGFGPRKRWARMQIWLDVRRVIRRLPIAAADRQVLRQVAREEIKLGYTLSRMDVMQKWFAYWHVAHRPFAIIMLVIALVHIIVTLAFGATWIW